MKNNQNILTCELQQKQGFWQEANPFFGIQKNKRETPWFFIAVFVLLSPIVYSVLYSFFPLYYYNINMLLAFCIFATISVLFVKWIIFEKKKNERLKEKWFSFLKNFSTVLLAGLFLWATLSLFFSTNLKLSLTGRLDNHYVEEGYFQYIAYALIFVCFFQIKNEQTKMWLIRFFVLVATICAILSLVDSTGKFMPGFSKNTYKYSAMFVNPNHAGYYMCMAVLASVLLANFEKNKMHQVLQCLSFIIISIYLFLNDSLGPELAVFFAILFAWVFVWIKQKKFNWILLVFFLAFILISVLVDVIPLLKNQRVDQTGFVVEFLAVFDNIFKTNISSIAEKRVNMVAGADGYDRIEMWRLCFENAINHPVFGTGIGTFGNFNGQAATSFRPHNEFFQIMSQMGFSALILYLGAIVVLFGFAFKKKIQTSTVIALGAMFAYLISAFFGNSVPHVFPVFIALFAFASTGVFKVEK